MPADYRIGSRQLSEADQKKKYRIEKNRPKEKLFPREYSPMLEVLNYPMRVVDGGMEVPLHTYSLQTGAIPGNQELVSR
jgi:hypothetical protein